MSEIKNPNRRQFLSSSSQVLAGIAMGVGLSSCADDDSPAVSTNSIETNETAPEGQVTQYFEFRVAPPVNSKVVELINTQAQALLSQNGFLSLSLKQMVGESTMVKNLPASYKGLLGNAHQEAIANQSLPFFYSLFVRFEDYAALQAANFGDWFIDNVVPELYVYQPNVGKTDLAFHYYTGVYQTVLCGDRSTVYSDAADISQFLRSQTDSPDKGYTTVANHVAIEDAQLPEFERRIAPLLNVAQNTYRPADASDGIGEAGSASNTTYKKAVTTEILRNAFAQDGERDYLMHGVWESVWDHENSHLDIRFMQASMPVGALVIKGPVEPFYQTRVQVNQV